MEKVKRVIDICAALQVTYLRVFAGFAPAEQVFGQRWKNMVDSLIQCADYASEKSVVLCVETHGGVNVYKDGVEHFYSTSAEPILLYRMLNELPQTVKVVYDPANLFAAGVKKPQEVYSRIQDRIGYLHLKDFKRTASGHFLPSACGEGSVDWPPLLATLKTFDGPVLFEYEMPQDVERGSKACLNFLLGEKR